MSQLRPSTGPAVLTFLSRWRSILVRASLSPPGHTAVGRPSMSKPGDSETSHNSHGGEISNSDTSKRSGYMPAILRFSTSYDEEPSEPKRVCSGDVATRKALIDSAQSNGNRASVTQPY